MVYLNNNNSIFLRIPVGYGIEPCFSFICENGGTCRAAGDEAKCLCPKRWGFLHSIEQSLQKLILWFSWAPSHIVLSGDCVCGWCRERCRNIKYWIFHTDIPGFAVRSIWARSVGRTAVSTRESAKKVQTGTVSIVHAKPVSSVTGTPTFFSSHFPFYLHEEWYILLCINPAQRRYDTGDLSWLI